MSILPKLLHSSGLDKLNPKLRNYVLTRGFCDEITHPGSEIKSSYKPWQRITTGAGLGTLAFALSPPAIVEAAKNEKNYPVYNKSGFLGHYRESISLRNNNGGQDYIEVTYDKEGISYKVKDRFGRDKIPTVFGEPTSGYIRYKEVDGIVEQSGLEKRERSEIVDFFRRFAGVEDSYKHLVAENLLQLSINNGNVPTYVANEIRKGIIKDQPQKETKSSSSVPITLENRFKKYQIASEQGPIDVTVNGNKIDYEIAGVARSIDRNTSPTNSRDISIVTHVINAEREQIKKELEERGVKAYLINSKKGPIYVTIEGSSVSYASTADGKLVQVAKEQWVPNSGIEDIIDASIFNSKGVKMREAFKKWLLRFSPNISVTEMNTMFSLMAEGFKPIFIGEYNGKGQLLGVQFSGSYSRVTKGTNVFEGDLGLVFNKEIDEKSMLQIGGFYQIKYDQKHDAIYGVVSGILAYQSGNIELSFYAGFPVTDRQKIKSERSSSESDATSTSGSVTTTTRTKVETVEATYREPRKVFAWNIRYDLDEKIEGLAIDLGGVWRSGIDSYIRERGSTKETREDVPSEFKGRIGLEYVLQGLSEWSGVETRIRAQLGIGQGNPEFFVSMTWYFDREYPGAKTRKIVQTELNKPAPRLEPISEIEYNIKKETTTKTNSPTITSTCPTTGSEGTLYTCNVTYSGSTPTVITGPSFLSLEDKIATSAKYRGTPGFTDSGTYNIKIRVRSSEGLDSFIEYTLTISDVNRNPTVTMDSPASNLAIDAGDFVNFQSTANDPDGDALAFTWTVTTVAGACPAIASVEDPGAVTFNVAGNCDIRVSVDDGKGGTANSATRRITVGGGGG